MGPPLLPSGGALGPAAAAGLGITAGGGAFQGEGVLATVALTGTPDNAKRGVTHACDPVVGRQHRHHPPLLRGSAERKQEG